MEIIFRTAIVYLFILLALRIFGKRELSQISVLDLIFILLISNSVQAAMVGSDVSLPGGIIAATTLFAVNLVLDYLANRSKKVGNFIQGNPVMLIYKGKILEEKLHALRISHDELEAAVREHGVKSIKDVDLAIFEADGNISVLSHDFTKKTTRKRKGHRIIGKEIM